MNRSHELPPELRDAYTEGYELAKSGGWLNDIPVISEKSENHEPMRPLLRAIMVKQIGFIDGLKEVWPK